MNYIKVKIYGEDTSICKIIFQLPLGQLKQNTCHANQN